MIGPSGSGKSTTIAKIAGGLKSKCGAKVGLISLPSNNRASAGALLESARAFDMPLEVPRSRDELQRTIWNLRDSDAILIDTPGVNPGDAKAVKSVGSMLNLGLPIEKGLVLSLTASEENQIDACKGFGALEPDCLVVTR